MAHDLETDRLQLRPCRRDDLASLYILWTEREVRRWFWDGRTIEQREAEQAILASERTFSERRVGIWSVVLRRTNALAGVVGLLTPSHPFYDHEIFSPEDEVVELFFAFLSRHRGRGYATEASKAVLAYGFEGAGLEEVVAVADQPNLGSLRVLDNCGMSRSNRLEIDGQVVHLFARSRNDV